MRQQPVMVAVVTDDARRFQGEAGKEVLMVRNSNYNGYFFPVTRLKTDTTPEKAAVEALRSDISAASNQSEQVKREAQAAVSEGKPIFTVRLEDVPLSKHMKYFIGTSHWLDASSSLQDDLQRLIGSVERLLQGAVPEEEDAGEFIGEVRSFQGHSDAVRGVAFTPDGRRIVSCSQDRTIRLWDVDSGRELRRFTGHSRAVLGIAISPSGANVLSCGGSGDNSVRLWDLAQGRELRKLTGHQSAVTCVTFASQGRQALSGGSDKSIRLWDLEGGGEVRRLLGHRDSVDSVACSPDGRCALSASKDGTVRPWDLQDGRELSCFQEHSGIVWQAIFSGDGRHVVSGGSDNLILLWSAETQQEKQSCCACGCAQSP